MKKFLFVISAILLIIGTIFVFNLIGNEAKSSSTLIENEANKSPKALLPANELMSGKLDEFDRDRYNDISSIMISSCNTDDKNVVQEYIVANNLSLIGIEHIDIKVFSDRTGEMIRKFYNSEFKDKGEFIVNKTFALTVEKVAQIEKVFENNNFWEIPSIHPEENHGLDGNTVFVEGVKGNKYNLISMWCPDDKYEIKKIYDNIMVFVNTWEPIK